MVSQIQNITRTRPYHRNSDRAPSHPRFLETEEARRSFSQCLSVAQAVLPFIRLYKPLGQPLSIALGSTRVICSTFRFINEIKTRDYETEGKPGNYETEGKYALDMAVSIAALACSIFAHPLGMLAITSLDMRANVMQLNSAIQKKDYKNAAESGLHLTNNVLYLGCIFAGSLEWSIALLGAQTFLGLYHSCDEFKKGNYLEGCGHMAMAGIRGKQLYDQARTLQSMQTSCKALPPEHQEFRERDAIKNNPRLREVIGDRAYEIKKTENGYLVEIDKGAIRVDVHYLPREDGILGPLRFELIFHELSPFFQMLPSSYGQRYVHA